MSSKEISERIGELIEVLERVESKILYTTFIRAGLSYLYFTMGLLGSMLLSIITALIEIGNVNIIGLIHVCYWLLILAIIFKVAPKDIRRAITALFGEEYLSNQKTGRDIYFRVLYPAGWIIGSIIWITLSILYNAFWSGFTIFVGIGNLFIYLSILLAYRVNLVIQLVVSLLLLSQSIITHNIWVYRGDYLAGAYAMVSVTIIYLFTAIYYLRRAFK